MSALTAAELLDAWERGAAHSPTWRPLALLAALAPATPEAVADWTVGRRDAELLRLRERAFGSRLAATAACPGCGERLELAFDAGEIRARPGEAAAAPAGELALAVAGWELRFRLPTGRDLAAAAASADLEEARRALIGRCLLAARHGGEEAAASALPATVMAALEAAMEAADPQAHVRLDLACPACARRWQAPFDVDAFFWAELDAWARRTLAEVHALAVAYGWSEAEILALSAARRHLYLGMVGLEVAGA